MDNKRTTILAFVAVAVMLAVCFMGFAVIGDEGSDADSTDSDEVKMVFTGTVTVDGKEFTNDFQGAIDAAKSSTSKTIKFTGNSSFNKTGEYAIESGVPTDWLNYDVSGLTIDLSGHTVTIERKMALILVGDEDFTVCNGDIKVPEGGDSYLSYALYIGINPTDTDAEYTKVTLRDLNLLGGVNARDYYDISVENLNVIGTNYYALWCEEGAKMTVDECTYESWSTNAAKVIALENTRGSAITIQDGQFKIDKGQAIALSGEGFVAPTIKGGFFYKVGGDSDSALKKELQGYLADGYQIVNATYGENIGYEVIGTASIETGGKIVYYASIQDAIEAATDGQTVKLLKNITTTESIVVEEKKDVVVDLNGYNITGNITATSGTAVDNTNTGAGHVFVNYGKLTISGEGKVSTDLTGCAIILNMVGGTVDLKGGTYKITNKNGYYAIKNLGEMNIGTGLTITGTTESDTLSSLIANGWYDGSENTSETYAKLTINGGTFSGGLNTLKNDDYGVAIVNDGTFENTVQCSVMNWNELTIDGGTFTQNAVDNEPVLYTGKNPYEYTKGTTTINGGTFQAGNNNVCIGLGSASGVTYTINGGTFSDLSGITYVTKNGTYELNTSASLSKSISMESGATLSVGKGTTLTIPEDVVFTGTVVGPEDNTFVANGVKAGKPYFCNRLITSF